MTKTYATINVYKEDGYWVAKNVGLDILTSSPDRITAVIDIMKCTEAHLKYKADLKIMNNL